MLEPLLQKWNALSSRDRRMLGLAAGFLVLVFAWMVAFEPAWDGRRQQGNVSAAQLRGRIEDSLADAGLSSSVAQLDVNGEIIEARFRQADFEKWLFWLDGAVRETRMRVVDLSVTREATGVISGRLALEAPRRGQ